MEGDRQQREGGGMAAAPTREALKRGEIDEARVAQVAALIEVASALEDVVTAKGGAGLGSIVTVTAGPWHVPASRT